MERVTRAEAARALGVAKGTVWNWVKNHPALLGDDGLVDLGELRAHREQVANPALQTRLKSKAAAEPDAEPASRAGGAVLNGHRARGEAAKAIHAELDLAERLKLTLVREDVEAQIASAGEVIKRKADEMAKDLSEKLARMDDPRVIEQTLRAGLRRMLDQASTALIVAMAPEDKDNDAA